MRFVDKAAKALMMEFLGLCWLDLLLFLTNTVSQHSSVRMRTTQNRPTYLGADMKPRVVVREFK